LGFVLRYWRFDDWGLCLDIGDLTIGILVCCVPSYGVVAYDITQKTVDNFCNNNGDFWDIRALRAVVWRCRL
jgi:hypothetical protein